MTNVEEKFLKQFFELFIEPFLPLQIIDINKPIVINGEEVLIENDKALLNRALIYNEKIAWIKSFITKKMNDYTILYKIRFNVGKFQGQIKDIEVNASELELDSLVGVLIDREYLEFWTNNNEYSLLNVVSVSPLKNEKNYKKQKTESELLAFTQYVAGLELGCAPSVGFMEQIILKARKAVESENDKPVVYIAKAWDAEDGDEKIFFDKNVCIAFCQSENNKTERYGWYEARVYGTNEK